MVALADIDHLTFIGAVAEHNSVARSKNERCVVVRGFALLLFKPLLDALNVIVNIGFITDLTFESALAGLALLDCRCTPTETWNGSPDSDAGSR